MSDIFTIIGALITGIGGSSIIILGLSKWLANQVSIRLIEKEKVKYEKELNDYKSQIEKAMITLKTMNEKALHTTKIQYDKEFEIYQNIWRVQIECLIESNNLFPNRDKDILLKEEKEKRYKTFITSLNMYLKEIHYNAPFYKEDFHNDFVLIWDKCTEVARMYKQGIVNSNSDENDKGLFMTYKGIFDDIKNIQEKLRIDIQKYLCELRGDYHINNINVLRGENNEY